MRKRIILAVAIVSALAVGAGAGLAAEHNQGSTTAVPVIDPPAAATGCDPEPVPSFLEPPVFLAGDKGGKGGKGGGSITATCSADCQCGPNQVCTGSSCYAVDHNCPTSRGHCWGTSTGYRYCPTCKPCCGWCSATADCSNAGGGQVSCTGCSGDCLAVDDCWAYCAGQYHFCPFPRPGCPW